MALTDKAISNAKPREKPYKLFDGEGLYLWVNTKGSKLWRLKYRFADREKVYGIGTYPAISLAEARNQRSDAKALIKAGRDPVMVRREERALTSGETFKSVAVEYWDGYKKSLSESSQERDQRFVDVLVKYLGDRPIVEIEPPDALAVIRRIESNGNNESAHRVRGMGGRISRYAIACGKATRDPFADIKDALKPVVSRHHPGLIEPKQVGELLRRIDGYTGQPTTIAALKLLAYCFPRPGELRQATWNEFDLDAKEWRIPAARMKMKNDHLVPLSKQAVAILREVHDLTGPHGLVFPASGRKGRPLSENTMNVALIGLGYRGIHCSHGFRTTADTLLNELGWNPDAIERQLAHVEGNNVRAAYNRAQYLPERRKMMTGWASYLDGLRKGSNVISIGKKVANT